MIKAEDRPEIRPLTGIRGFAALLVLMIHFSPYWSCLVPALHGFGRLSGRGFIGVDLFFILSGFILNYVYFDAARPGLDFGSYRSFVWHRFIRVWPVHLATLVLLLGLVLAARCAAYSLTGNYAWGALPFQLTMTHAWPVTPVGSGPDPIAAFSWNYPSWSISSEWFAYLLVFPLTWRLLHRLQQVREAAILGIAGAVIAGWSLGLRPLPLCGCGMVCQVTMEFITGALLFQAFAGAGGITRWCQRSATPIFVIVVAALLVAPVSATPWIILLFPALLLGLTAETSWIARFFATRPALWLGRISYSVYMSQAIVQRLLKIALPAAHFQSSPLGLRLAVLAATIMMIIGAGYGFYYLVETPIRVWLRRWADRRLAARLAGF